MLRGNISDTTDYKPSFRHFVETDYWSDENICRAQVNFVSNLWNTLLTANINIADRKDHTVDDAQLTPNSKDQKQKSVDKRKNQVYILMILRINLIIIMILDYLDKWLQILLQEVIHPPAYFMTFIIP